MKLIFVIALLASSSLFAETKITKNVTICATVCQDLSLAHINHDMAQSGEIYVAAFNQDNSSNTNVCLSNAGESLALASDRGTTEVPVGIDTEACTEILKGQYYGKNVTIESEDIEDHSYVTKIYPTKK